MLEETEYTWTLAAAFVGVIVNTYIFGIVLFQFLIYFTTDFKDNLWIKCVVSSLLIIDIVHSCGMIYIPWFLFVENYNNPSTLLYPLWPYLITPILDSLSAVITQLFLVFRGYKIIHNPYLACVIICSILTSFAFGIGAGISAWQLPSIADSYKVRYLCVPWLLFQATADIMISVTLSYSFWRTRTGNSQTDWALNTLFHKALQTGLPAAVVAILVLATYVQYGTHTSYLASTFALPHGRVYTLTLLDTLIVRTKLRQGMKITNMSQILNEDDQETRSPEQMELQLVRITSASDLKDAHSFTQGTTEKCL